MPEAGSKLKCVNKDGATILAPFKNTGNDLMLYNYFPDVKRNCWG
jgi:hypothetical protein